MRGGLFIPYLFDQPRFPKQTALKPRPSDVIRIPRHQVSVFRYFRYEHLLSVATTTRNHAPKRKKAELHFPKKGNPAIRLGPVVFRPHLTMSLALQQK